MVWKPKRKRHVTHAERALAALGVFAAQVWHTGHRPDLPSLSNQDPSAVLGDPGAPPLTIALLGDSSITAPGVHPLDDCWARRIGDHLARDHRVHLVSVAVGGSRATDVLRDQVPQALAVAPDIALVCVGANDALRAVPVGRFERDLTSILHRLQAGIPAIGMSGVGDLGPLPRLPSIGRAWARVRARSFDRAIARVCHRLGIPKTATWGSMWDRFEDPKNENGYYAADWFHASGKGHALFAASWLAVVDRLVAGLETDVTVRRGSSGSST